MIKAVIFDMDGVIVDSEPVHYEAHNKLLKSYGQTLSKEDIIKYVGLPTREVYKDIKEKFNLPYEVNELVKKKREIFASIAAEKVELMPHSKELIGFLRENGYKLAVASSGFKTQIYTFLQKFELADKFITVVSADDVAMAKPHPEIYLEAARRLGLKSSECLAIEDSDKGIESAKQAGMRVIAVPNAHTKQQDLSKADLIVSNLGDITLETIKNME